MTRRSQCGGQPTLIIRADGIRGLGSGHVMRMIALGQAWRGLGGRVVFVSACAARALRKRLCVEGFVVCQPPAIHPDPRDLAFLLRLVREQAATALVLDGYHFGLDYQQALRRASVRTLKVDDALPPDACACHFQLAPLAQGSASSPECRLLAGLDFVLLRSEFLSDAVRPARDRPRGLSQGLLTMGGEDRPGFSLQLMTALGPCLPTGLQLAVLSGPMNPRLKQLQERAAAFPALSVLASTQDMPRLLATRDIVIGAGGGTCYEAAFLGVPSLVFVTADNQTKAVDALAQQGLVVAGGDLRRMDVWEASTRVLSFLADAALRERVRRVGLARIDGRGAWRVARLLAGNEEAFAETECPV